MCNWAITGNKDHMLLVIEKPTWWLIPPVFTHYGTQNESVSLLNEQNEQYPPPPPPPPPKWAKMKGIRIFFYIFIYTFMEKFCPLLISPKWGDSLQRLCRQTILEIPSTFQRPSIQTVVQQIVDLWQYVASGLRNHKPSGVSHDYAMISHLGFPRIVQW